MRLGALEAILLIVVLAAYFIPSIIAVSRNHASSGGIVALNVLLGWTFVGWVGALIWSLSSKGGPTVVVNNHQSTSRHNTATVNATSQKASFQQAETLNANFEQRIEQLNKLKTMLDNGTLSEEEFNSEKSKILARAVS